MAKNTKKIEINEKADALEINEKADALEINEKADALEINEKADALEINKPDSLDNGLYVWVKKDGSEIHLNDTSTTIAAAKKLGWKQSK